MSSNTPEQDAITEIEAGLEALRDRAREMGMTMATFVGTVHIFTQYIVHRACTEPLDEEIH